MTAARVRAQQAEQPPAARMVRCTISGTDPLQVTLPGGAVVAAVAVLGQTYTTGATAWVWYDQPLVGPVFPIA